MQTKKLIFLLIAVITVISIMPGCGKKSSADNMPTSNTASAEQSAEPEMITIIDDRGIEVTFPKNPKRVVISSIIPLSSVYCLYHSGPKNLVGISAASMSAAEHSFLAKMYPEILNLEYKFSEGGNVNIEEVMKLEPDVVFYRANQEEEGDMYAKAGIPAVAFSTSKAGTDTIATFEGWIELLDQIFGGGDMTQGMVEYGNDIVTMLRERTANLKHEERPRAIVFSGFSNNQLTAAGGNIFADFYITEGGGVNVASEITNSQTVNMEQIYEWDPEVIFINNFCPYIPEDFYNNNIEGYDWSSVSAVKNQQIYKFPLGTYRWYPPAGDAPLSLVWVAKHLNPELFEDIDMDALIREYYGNFYGYEVTDEDLTEIYNPPREAATY